MRILVVGSGGREHALVWKLAQEAEVLCAPGNPGIASIAECLPIPPSGADDLIAVCKSREVDLVVVGPEDPLVAGLADRLREAGIATFGPGAEGAKLEASKAFSKELMRKAHVPTARYETFTDSLSARTYSNTQLMEGRGVVIKASGNALGKGVVVCSEPEEAEEAITDMLDDRRFGDAGAEIVIEERLVGFEFSLLTLCSDAGFYSLPIAQDYKRALDGDRGPNTGGMGSYSPVPRISSEMVTYTEAHVVAPILAALKEQGISFRGLLFSGLLVQDGEVYCLEYNVRFGDPETQTVVRRLGNGFAEALFACAEGRPIPAIELLNVEAVTVVTASGGYPGDCEKGMPITLGELPAGVELFHAGTGLKDGHLVTAGGRVIAVSAAAPTIAKARQLAYEGAQQVQFAGKYLRTDIAG
jgi:phosphoribosylamine---glycine ligase